MTLLSIDPGARIGWALFDDQGEEMGRGVYDFRLLSHSLHYKPNRAHDRLIFVDRGNPTETAEVFVNGVVYEAYYDDPNVNQGGSTGPAQEVIGVLKYLCLQAGIEPHFQRSAILPVAMKHWQYEVPLTRNGNKKHLPDEDSAWLHGKYYLTNVGVITPPMP